MSAIITDPFKKQFMQKILDEVTALSARYYVGIGKNDQWNSTETVPTPTDTPKSIRDARTSLQSVKAVAAASYVVPRNSWSQGAIYDAYDEDLIAFLWFEVEIDTSRLPLSFKFAVWRNKLLLFKFESKSK